MLVALFVLVDACQLVRQAEKPKKTSNVHKLFVVLLMLVLPSPCHSLCHFLWPQCLTTSLAVALPLPNGSLYLWYVTATSHLHNSLMVSLALSLSFDMHCAFFHACAMLMPCPCHAHATPALSMPIIKDVWNDQENHTATDSFSQCEFFCCHLFYLLWFLMLVWWLEGATSTVPLLPSLWPLLHPLLWPCSVICCTPFCSSLVPLLWPCCLFAVALLCPFLTQRCGDK